VRCEQRPGDIIAGALDCQTKSPFTQRALEPYMSSITQSLKFALAGWVAGAVAAVGVGFTWPTIFPAIIVVGHYYGAGPSLPTIILFAILIASPGGLAGGIIGSRIPREGGRTEQYLMAGIMGVIISLPFSCLILWLFTGWGNL